MRRFINYFKGIRFKNGEIHVATTGAIIPIDTTFRKSAFAMAKIYTYFLSHKLKQLFTGSISTGTIAFYPQNPGPWYNIWQVTRLAGLKTVPNINNADYIFAFEDSTLTTYHRDFAADLNAPKLNHHVKDISKEHVADIFEQTFGYPLRIDPTTHQGLAIQKSNLNGTHDGVIISCPIPKADVIPEQCYQRLVDSTFDGETSEDLRIAYVLGTIALVYHKHKPLDDRFGTYYLSVDVRMPEDIFSEEEIALIISFCKAMGLDFGAVDVMRDKHNNHIYIVDVNKTCMPVLSLTLKTQIQAQQKIANAFQAGLLKLNKSGAANSLA